MSVMSERAGGWGRDKGRRLRPWTQPCLKLTLDPDRPTAGAAQQRPGGESTVTPASRHIFTAPLCPAQPLRPSHVPRLRHPPRTLPRQPPATNLRPQPLHPITLGHWASHYPPRPQSSSSQGCRKALVLTERKVPRTQGVPDAHGCLPTQPVLPGVHS